MAVYIPPKQCFILIDIQINQELGIHEKRAVSVCWDGKQSEGTTLTNGKRTKTIVILLYSEKQGHMLRPLLCIINKQKYKSYNLVIILLSFRCCQLFYRKEEELFQSLPPPGILSQPPPSSKAYLISPNKVMCMHIVQHIYVCLYLLSP